MMLALALTAAVLCESSGWMYTDHGGLLEVLPGLAQRVSEGDVIARMTLGTVHLHAFGGIAGFNQRLGLDAERVLAGLVAQLTTLVLPHRDSAGSPPTALTP